MNQQTEGRGAAKRPLIKWAVRLGASVVVLGVTLWWLPTDQVWQAMARMPAHLWLASLLVYVAGHVVASMKWRTVLNVGAELPRPTAVRAHFAGLAANLCLPGAASGDVVRAGMIMRGSRHQAQIAVGSLADRLLDVFSLFVLASLGAVFLIRPGTPVLQTLLQIGGVLGALVAGAVLGIAVGRRLTLKGKLGALVRSLMTAIDGLLEAPGRLVRCILMSLAVQVIFLWVNIGIAEALNVHLSSAVWFMAWPLAKLIATLPISAAGIGVREAALIALVVPYGAAPADVLAVGLVWESVLLAGGLIGAGALLLGGGQGAGALAGPSNR